MTTLPRSFFALLCFTLISPLFTIGSSAEPTDAGIIRKRSILLENRQLRCVNPSWIPACPGKLSTFDGTGTRKLTKSRRSQGSFPCLPPGGICCSDDTYVLPPEICPDGSRPVATAIKEQASAPTPAITSAVEFTEAAFSYTWFTTEYTWYYWYYYYTYIAVGQSTIITSSQATSVTTVSVSATASAQASALFESLRNTLSFPTPKQTATALVGSTPAATFTPIKTAAFNVTLPTRTQAPTSPAVFVGSATALKVRFTGSWYGGLFWAPCVLVLALCF